VCVWDLDDLAPRCHRGEDHPGIPRSSFTRAFTRLRGLLHCGPPSGHGGRNGSESTGLATCQVPVPRTDNPEVPARAVEDSLDDPGIVIEYGSIHLALGQV
jgi:hypothetical protein